MTTELQLSLRKGVKVVDGRHDKLTVPTYLLQQCLVRLEAPSTTGTFRHETNFDRPVGQRKVLPVRPDDQLIEARRAGAPAPSRFFLNRATEPANIISVILTKDTDDGPVVLLATYFGPLSPAEPWDQRAFHRDTDPVSAQKDSNDFWLHGGPDELGHAFVLGGSDVRCMGSHCAMIVPKDRVASSLRSGKILCFHCQSR